MSPFPQIPISLVEDNYVNRAFKIIVDFLRDNSPLLDFKHYELSFDADVTDFKFKHNLGYLPKDLLVTFVKNGTITFSYEDFDKDNITLSVSGTDGTNPCVLRFLLGSYNSSP